MEGYSQLSSQQSNHHVRNQRIRDYNSKYIQYENSIINKLSEPSKQHTNEMGIDVSPCEATLQDHDLQDPNFTTQSGYCVRVLVKIELRSAPGKIPFLSALEKWVQIGSRDMVDSDDKLQSGCIQSDPDDVLKVRLSKLNFNELNQRNLSTLSSRIWYSPSTLAAWS